MPTTRRSRSILRSLALLPLLLLAPAAGLLPSPPGAGVEPAAAQPPPAATPGVTRYFGRGAYEGIRAAVAATPRACHLPDHTLTALVMAPIFKEVSMAETPQTAPSPMTLSRWDEWSGDTSGPTNLDANYGLYAFNDPRGTPYPRAYWTPGIGIFQYDVAGVGAPFTAAEMMDVEFIARDVAAGMAQRYCGAPGDDLAKRTAAWRPWDGLGGVAKSEALLQEMVGLGRPPFATIGLVDGIDKAGGMRASTCVVRGTQVPCHHVDPAKAQGANWWATDDPSGGAVASGEAPLPAPFYVVKWGNYEERHWLAEDTGYPVDILARRRLGRNARPMRDQPGSGLHWAEGSDLCDTARPETGCRPTPEPEEPAAEPDGEARGDRKAAAAKAGEAKAGREAGEGEADGREVGGRGARGGRAVAPDPGGRPGAGPAGSLVLRFRRPSLGPWPPPAGR